MPVYSFGVKSDLKFQLTEEYADSYNRGARAFGVANNRFKTVVGRDWTVNDLSLKLECSVQDFDAFVGFAEILKKELDRRGVTLEQVHILEDQLVQN
jgi:hypothetical protein